MNLRTGKTMTYLLVHPAVVAVAEAEAGAEAGAEAVAVAVAEAVAEAVAGHILCECWSVTDSSTYLRTNFLTGLESMFLRMGTLERCLEGL